LFGVVGDIFFLRNLLQQKLPAKTATPKHASFIPVAFEPQRTQMVRDFDAPELLETRWRCFFRAMSNGRFQMFSNPTRVAEGNRRFQDVVQVKMVCGIQMDIF
jgi:hypothetical protein